MHKLPGTPVRGSQTGRPIMVLLDVLGQRWTLRLLWELSHDTATFRALRSRCDDVSPTVLNQRLKELRGLGLVDLGENGYELTSMGMALAGKFASLDAWANEWAENLEKHDISKD
ncbi:helix-turn-helix domain-containing protein [Aquidulcibacter sp.]|uniref:winged helix-turn-helix transcriptional regulator n=1 Tax=Aquidulcibacter sp. TaxID=2052990 RepID=UPI00261563B3|nr:helix-turn-helix domain-containing protein [Aquidulcibacter sp.]